MDIFIIYLIFSMLAVLWFDVSRYTIPNWLNASILLLYPLAVWMAPHPIDWQNALLGTAIVFAVGYIIFAMRWMGGGDIKLITALSLWVGFATLSDFLIMVALIGGVFAIAVWLLRKVMPFMARQFPKLPRILRNGEPIPYGVAIAGSFLWLIWTGRIEALTPLH